MNTNIAAAEDAIDPRDPPLVLLGSDATERLRDLASNRAAHHDDLVERALAAEACEPKRVKMPTLKRISTWDEARFGCTQEQAEEIVTAARVFLARGAMHAGCARRARTAADDGRTRDAAKFNAEADHWRHQADEATAALAKAVRDAEPVDACPHCGAPLVSGTDHGSGGSGDAEPPEVPSIACSRHDEGCTYRV